MVSRVVKWFCRNFLTHFQQRGCNTVMIMISPCAINTWRCEYHMPKHVRLTGFRYFFIGFSLVAGVAYGFTETGAWNLPTPWTFTEPRAKWAQVIFAPGIATARWSFFTLFKPMFTFRTAMWFAGGVGVVTMGLVGGSLAWMFAVMRGRR